jgi:predicted Rossmann fold flavoprotein
VKEDEIDCPQQWHAIIIGGGAAGIFGAITCAEEIGEDARVLVLERGRSPLQKVRISGGGRCNVTHDCPEARRMSTHYPRGERALIGPLTRWGTADTVAWFEQRGIRLKTESDGRIFPTTDDSATIIDCLLGAAADAGVELRTGCEVKSLAPLATSNGFELVTGDDEMLHSRAVLLATGGVQAGSSTEATHLACSLGHQLSPPVPSLFTFKINDARLEGLQGLSVPEAKVRIPDTGLEASGPLLITHWGLSGPGILKISAWGARILAEHDYQFALEIDWVNGRDPIAVMQSLRQNKGSRRVINHCPFKEIPRRLWEQLATHAAIPPAMNWSQLSKACLNQLALQLSCSVFQVHGKSTHKEEFVTCGGAALGEIDLRTMESKLQPGLYFAGEVMNVDGVTGGFNFQHAWCSGYHAGVAMARQATKNPATPIAQPTINRDASQ